VKHTIASFSGGLTDIAVGDSPVALEQLNFEVRDDGSMFVRDGSATCFAILPSGAHRVAWLGKFEETFFAVCAKELYYWYTTTPCWVRITPYGINDSVFAYGDYNSVVSAALVGRDLILCTTPAVGGTVANVPMRVIWDDNFGGTGVGGWTAMPLGLPPVSLKYDTAGNVSEPLTDNVTVEGEALVDAVFNFAACFYCGVTSRGRLRLFFGPRYAWQNVVRYPARLNNSRSRWAWCWFAWWTLMQSGFTNNLKFFIPQPGASSALKYCDLQPWANTANDRYPLSLMRVGLFRSKANSSQLYWIGSFENTSADLSAMEVVGDDHPQLLSV
jgi:hypothetical protein